MTHIETLKSLDACEEAVEWAKTQPDFETAWANCHHYDWMLWLDCKMNLFTDSERRLVACALVRRTPVGDGRMAWDLLTDERSRNAVKVAERHARGEATDEELDAAWSAAQSAARSPARLAAGYAAWESARHAAAMSSAMSAAMYAAWSAARSAQADIIREWPNPFTGNAKR